MPPGRPVMQPMRRAFPALLVFVVAGLGLARAEEPAPETIHYGIEIDGVLCGYARMDVSHVAADDKTWVDIDERIFLMVSALGSKFNTDIRLTYRVDPATGEFVTHTSRIEQGQVLLTANVTIEDGVAVCTSNLEDEATQIELGDDVLLENPLRLPHLLRDFADGERERRTYRVFEVSDQKVQDCTYTRSGRETLTLAGTTYDTLVLDRRNEATGVKSTYWIDTATARVVQIRIASNRRVFVADASVTKRIRMANLDATITTPTNVTIADVQGITFMKVRAVMSPTGLCVTREALEVPGQRFEGTVAENRIEGVFSIEHPRYDGTDAPPFPPSFASQASLTPYLEPDGFIDADDPVLVEAARRITEGATDAWDASRRLAAWVADNIDYAIPGGGTARKTYDTRTGECGAHSVLYATFCRALGIPARVVWGCMYVPNLGGAFGQHAWNEVYMGDAGWVPIDTTATEIDFVDSGHVRIGELSSRSIAVNMIEMEILDHRVESGTTNDAASTARYEPYLGSFTDAESGLVANVVVKDGSLVVAIPGRITFALEAEDAEGRRYATISNRLYCTFDADEAGDVLALRIHEIVRMQRTAAPSVIPESVPSALRDYLGSYLLAPVQATFEVIYREGGLAVRDPLAGKTVGFEPTDVEGRFLDEYGKNTISFERDDDGTVRALRLDAQRRFTR